MSKIIGEDHNNGYVQQFIHGNAIQMIVLILPFWGYIARGQVKE